MPDITYPLFPIFSFIGFVLSLIPLSWHLQAWNSGTCYYMMWAAISCLNQFINSVVWSDDALNRAPIWCEICTSAFVASYNSWFRFGTAIRILLASSVGLPAASLCINRRLYQIASVRDLKMGRPEVGFFPWSSIHSLSILEIAGNSGRHSHLRCLPHCICCITWVFMLSSG